MNIEVSQFHQAFFEESNEGLHAMEMGLLNLQTGMADNESINRIFRAAHSIKGGADTFGFSAILDFIHNLEALLDQMRNDERKITTDAVNAMLEAVDVLREMLTAAEQQCVFDDSRAQGVSLSLSTLLDDDEMTAVTPDEHPAVNVVSGWEIDFKPHPDMLQTGNDPVRMFTELAELGELTVSVNDDTLPAFTYLNPEESYLSWHLTLLGDVSRDALNDIFEWVENDCDLTITPVTPSQAIAKPLPAESVDSEITQTVPVTEPAVTMPVATKAASNSIRVGTEKVDSLINLVGELVITQSMLSQLGDNFDADTLPRLIDGLEQLERNTRELQESIMRIRMLPISFTFNRFPRLVHDLTEKMGKQVTLRVSGEQTELDKTVMEKIADPLVHLVRNALAHGLETPQQRLAAGKEATGLLQLHAYHQGGNIIIELSDDGAGLNEDRILQKAIEKGLVAATDNLPRERIHELIFLPGFTTADVVSDVSGRGVGMDVVKKNIHSLGGSIDVHSERGLGSTFIIRLPLTLAIMDGQIIQVGEQRYIIPLISIVESVEMNPAAIKQVAGEGEAYPLGDEYVPLVRLRDIFNLDDSPHTEQEGLVVIVDDDDRKVGLYVDELLMQQQVVMKSLETNFRKVMGVAGATILDDGAVALILDIAGLMALYRNPELGHPLHTTQAA